MDIFWVPDVGPSGENKGEGTPMSNEQQLFLVGFIILALCALAGSLLVDGTVAKTAERLKMRWVIDAVAFFPWIGFLLQNTGAIIGSIKSKAPAVKRMAWFVVTQSAACGLWWASSLH